MKKIALLCLVTFISLQAFAQQAETDKRFYMVKVEKYRRMKNTGTVLTVVGGVLFGVGLAVGLNSSETTTSTIGGPSQTTTTGNPALGAAAFLLGGAGLGAGIPIWIVGAHSEKKYKNKLDGVTLTINPQIHGLTVRYRF